MKDPIATSHLISRGCYWHPKGNQWMTWYRFELISTLLSSGYVICHWRAPGTQISAICKRCSDSENVKVWWQRWDWIDFSFWPTRPYHVPYFPQACISTLSCQLNIQVAKLLKSSLSPKVVDMGSNVKHFIHQMVLSSFYSVMQLPSNNSKQSESLLLSWWLLLTLSCENCLHKLFFVSWLVLPCSQLFIGLCTFLN